MNRWFFGLLFVLASVFASRVWQVSFLGVEALRVGFGPLFVLIGAMYLGPSYGFFLGFFADILGFTLQSGNGLHNYLPQISLMSALRGFLAGHLFYARKSSTRISDLFLVIGIPQVLFSVFAMSFILYAQYDVPLALQLRTRFMTQLVTIPVYVLIAYVLFRQRESEQLARKTEGEYRHLISQMEQGFARYQVVYDKAGSIMDYRYLDVNQSYERLIGLKRGDLLGRTLFEVVPKPEPALVCACLEVAQKKEARKLEIYSKRAKRYLSVTIYAPLGEEIAVIFDDITEAQEAKSKLQERELRYSALVNHSYDLIWELTPAGSFSYASPSWKTTVGYDPSFLLGKGLYHFVHPEDVSMCRAHMEEVEKTKRGSKGPSCRFRHSDGSFRWHEGSLTPVFSEAGVLLYFVGVTRDVTEEKEARRKIEYLSFHDGLTALSNRRHYEEQLEKLDDSQMLPLSLLIVDVNGLKLTNDAFGHRAGDCLLKTVAGVLRGTFREKDVVARIGGDEFAILLPQTKAEEVEQLAEELLFRMSVEQVHSLPVSVSCGFATKKSEEEQMEDVFKLAEDRMYQEKVSEMSSYRHQTLQLIMQTLYAKSQRESKHSERVALLCRRVGLAMGFSQKELKELVTVAELHDIGKIVVDNEILDKSGSLSEAEWHQIRRHPHAGHSILSAVHDYGPLAESVLAHHERWDGSGYPTGLVGDQIPLHARIIAIADSYDAMVSDRPYRRGMSHGDALEEIAVCSGFQFDPAIVTTFLQVMQGEEGKLEA